MTSGVPFTPGLYMYSGHLLEDELLNPYYSLTLLPQAAHSASPEPRNLFTNEPSDIMTGTTSCELSPSASTFSTMLTAFVGSVINGLSSGVLIAFLTG